MSDKATEKGEDEPFYDGLCINSERGASTVTPNKEIS